ncbi:hypothetical protein BDB01DRAFT_839927 [Pilobolus umbonatus]|nr:hypothetical protein BDB01DRAFT_839927 [Pilobolus umbonatus]
MRNKNQFHSDDKFNSGGIYDNSGRNEVQGLGVRRDERSRKGLRMLHTMNIEHDIWTICPCKFRLQMQNVRAAIMTQTRPRLSASESVQALFSYYIQKAKHSSSLAHKVIFFHKRASTANSSKPVFIR